MVQKTFSLSAVATLLLAVALLLFPHQPAEAQVNSKAVSNVSVSSPNPGEVTVSWDAPSDAPDDYRVTWKKSSGKWPSYKKENTVEGGNAFPTGTSHTVSNMEEGTAYKVRVRSRFHDTNGNVEQSGPWSAAQEFTVSVTPTPTPEPTEKIPKSPPEKGGDEPRPPRSTRPPATPTGLLAATGHDNVMLIWDNPDDDTITGYQILRGPDATNLAVLTTDTGSASASYADNTVDAETNYAYAVKARNANGLSPQSDPISVRTLEAPEDLETSEQIAGVDFTLGGQTLDTAGSNCDDSQFSNIVAGCTITLLNRDATLAIVGTYDSNDRISVRIGRDSANLTEVASGDIEDLDGQSDLDLTFELGPNLMRLWGDEDGTSGGGKEHFYRINVELAASIEAVKSPVVEGEEEVQFRITLSDAAPAGGVNVMVELAPVAQYENINPVSVADYKTHNVHIPQGQTDTILEILTTRDKIANNHTGVTATLLPGTGYIVGDTPEAEVVISDPDQVNVRFADGCGQTITVAERDGEVSIDIVLDNPVAFDFTLTLALINGYATENNDFSGGIEVIKFDHLQTRLTHTVPIIYNSQIEPTEDFFVRIQRSGLDSDILTPTCGAANPQLTVEITDDDTANIALDAPEEVTEGQPIKLGLGPRPNVDCLVPFEFTTTLTITGATSALQDSTSEMLELRTCGSPEVVHIENDDGTNSEPIWQTIDQPGQQGDRQVTFTIGPLRSSNSLVSKLIPERRSATVTIKDKPNSKAAGSPIITGDLVVGDTLTVDTSEITDKDGLANAEFTYRWYKTDRVVTEELSTDISYTVREEDKGDQIRLTVSFTDDEGFHEELTAVPTGAVLPYIEHYFLIADKRLMEAINGTRTVGTWVYLSDWPRIRSTDGSRLQNWGVNPPVPFTIPYTVTYEDGAAASWVQVEDVTFTATQSGSVTTFQGRSNMTVTIKQIGKLVDKRHVPYGQDLGKIVITLDDGIDLPNNGPKLNVREGQDTLTITIVSNGK